MLYKLCRKTPVIRNKTNQKQRKTGVFLEKNFLFIFDIFASFLNQQLALRFLNYRIDKLRE